MFPTIDISFPESKVNKKTQQRAKSSNESILRVGVDVEVIAIR
jgi:hypothetical protein